MSLRKEILDYVKSKYGTVSEHLWKSHPSYEVLRHAPKSKSDKGKWYGIVMDVKPKVIGLEGEENIDILDIKCDPNFIQFLRGADGYFPAYHMNKKHWITVLLDGTIPLEDIKKLIDESFNMTL
ncbi:Predicted DNA-binding protein, MmcQ/YjbR family [Clostridium sp. DSM 8431]|uniref:MmcQ/YjbR family DNA-binding protein n=1 Tax=Clostridium sp. DSM 8431 TaxID=1761781 RepID=UPI0008E7F347|nr:MmcQ/YjbR family DNA-binding protein [Clostridium sp. DSM 8431]SFU33369.1 Predicted DNA-binding protein, MmcQ/YjbR family [Clostridium sp. DSM 8431]